MNLFAARCCNSWLWQDAYKVVSQNLYKMWSIVIVDTATTTTDCLTTHHQCMPIHTIYSSLWLKATTIQYSRWIYLRPDAAIVDCDRRYAKSLYRCELSYYYYYYYGSPEILGARFRFGKGKISRFCFMQANFGIKTELFPVPFNVVSTFLK